RGDWQHGIDVSATGGAGDLTRQRGSVDLRQHDIRHEQIDRRMALRDRHRFLRGGGEQDVVAEPLQDVAPELPDRLLILDDEDRLRASDRCGSATWRRAYR